MKPITLELLKTMPLPDLSDQASKKTRGKLLIISGSRRLPGAAILAAQAALRAGCGTVRVAAPASIATQIGIAVPELMVIPLPETSAGTVAKDAFALVAEQCELCDAGIIGPGLDENEETAEFCREVVQTAPLPFVVDASAILAFQSAFRAPKGGRVFTPHEVEFEALSGQKPGENPEEVAQKWALGAQSILALKGATTYVCDGESVFHTQGQTRVLGTAGSGDVLAGIIGSFLAQGLAPLHAATWGVQMHHYIGEEFQKEGNENGILARDFVDRLPGALKFHRKTATEKKGSGFGLRPA